MLVALTVKYFEFTLFKKFFCFLIANIKLSPKGVIAYFPLKKRGRGNNLFLFIQKFFLKLL